MAKKKSIVDFKAMKQKGEKISWLTCYDYHTAKFIERAETDMILVGDSLGGCVYGYPDDGMSLTIDVMVRHAEAVRRGAPNTFLIGDMPFLSYEILPEEAARNAGRYYKEASVDCVKLEGGRRMAKSIRAIVDAGMVVISHLGLLSQSYGQLGGHKIQGRTAENAMNVIEDARAVKEAGAHMVLLEGVTGEVAKFIRDEFDIPVLGIASGPYVDGQVLIVNDVVGITEGFNVSFLKQYANIAEYSTNAMKEYVKEVKEGKFPAEKNWNKMNEGEMEKLVKLANASKK